MKRGPTPIGVGPFCMVEGIEAENSPGFVPRTRARCLRGARHLFYSAENCCGGSASVGKTYGKADIPVGSAGEPRLLVEAGFFA